MNIHDSKGFKSFDRHVTQLKIPDSRIYPAEVQTAVYEALKSARDFSDKLYILENYLEDLLDREGGE